MLIVCPSCASEYTIDPAKLGADGRTLRCAICRDTWFVTPEGQSPQASASQEAPTETAPPAPGPAIAGRSSALRKGLAFGGIVTLATAAWLQFPSLFLSVETWARAG